MRPESQIIQNWGSATYRVWECHGIEFYRTQMATEHEGHRCIGELCELDNNLQTNCNCYHFTRLNSPTDCLTCLTCLTYVSLQTLRLLCFTKWHFTNSSYHVFFSCTPTDHSLPTSTDDTYEITRNRNNFTNFCPSYMSVMFRFTCRFCNLPILLERQNILELFSTWWLKRASIDDDGYICLITL